MIEDLTRYVDVLIELKITPNQFLLPYCLVMDRLKTSDAHGRYYTQRAGGSSPVANMYRYSSTVAAWSEAEVQDLVDKGILVGDKETKGKVTGYFPDTMNVTSKFISAVFASASDYDEMWEEYPAFVNNFQDPLHGPKVPLKAVSYEAAKKLYEAVCKTQLTHSRMMRAIRWGKENSQINLRIDKFLESRHWESLEQLMEDNYGSETQRTRGSTI